MALSDTRQSTDRRQLAPNLVGRDRGWLGSTSRWASTTPSSPAGRPQLQAARKLLASGSLAVGQAARLHEIKPHVSLTDAAAEAAE